MNEKKKIKLNELQLNNIGGWPREAQLGFCGLVVLLIVVLAWFVTIPLSAIVSGIAYLVIDGIRQIL